MSKRLQVLIPEARWRELRRLAKAKGIPVGEWVRRALDEACRREPGGRLADKLAALDRAFSCSFPTADIDVMNAEIEAGYAAGLEE